MAAIMDEDAVEVIREAERIVWAVGWRLQEEVVLDRLAGIKGLALARLEPRSEVIQLVTYDGEHLGHVRRGPVPGQEIRWVTVVKDQARRIGAYSSAAAAAAALARACGKRAERTG
jgi:hypothetical protein